MRFDRTAPGGGVAVESHIENGKVFLEFAFCFEEPKEQSREVKVHNRNHMWNHETESNLGDRNGYYVKLQMWNMCGKMVFACQYPLKEEEPAKGLLLHPHLWHGVEDAYVYRLKASLMEKANVLDELERSIPLYTMEQIPNKGWLLNGKAFCIRGVSYRMPSGVMEEAVLQKRIIRDLSLMQKIGANTLFLPTDVIAGNLFAYADVAAGDISVVQNGIRTQWFHELCDRMGFVVCPNTFGTEDMPKWEEMDCAYYRALWSNEPFVDIQTQSLKRQENGNYSVMVYSNQKKVALYVQGVLFEFRVGETEFLFEEIVVKKWPLLLAAEAGDCCVSVTVYPR